MPRSLAQRVFALTTRGLEDVSAAELGQSPGLTVTGVAYRRVSAMIRGELDPLLSLRTLDDVYLDLGTWEGIGRPRSALRAIERLAEGLDLPSAARVCSTVRWIAFPPWFSVTASFVGRRNYTTEEIKLAVAAGVRRGLGWEYTSDDRASDLNVRVFVEHETAHIGVRLGARPLHERGYKRVHLPGSLKPSVAAALVMLSDPSPGQTVLDPFCGAGTIVIEAALMGLEAAGGDADPEAVAAARENVSAAGVAARIERWDARSLPLPDGSVDRVVSNLPWGGQVGVEEELAGLYRDAFAEMLRVLSPGGRIVLLTSAPQLLACYDALCVERREISVFGRTPTVLVYAP